MLTGCPNCRMLWAEHPFSYEFMTNMKVEVSGARCQVPGVRCQVRVGAYPLGVRCGLVLTPLGRAFLGAGKGDSR